MPVAGGTATLNEYDRVRYGTGPERLDLLENEPAPFLRNPATVVVLSLVTIGVVAWLARLGHGLYSMSTFYIVPVAVVAWYVGRDWARVTAVLAGVVNATAVLAGAEVTAAPTALWNALMIVVICIAMGEVLGRLHAALEQERALARTDSLTGLPNARSFDEAATAEIERAKRYDRTFTVACLDLDHFKDVNDTQGHHAGDSLLRDVSTALRDNLRRVDVVARIGGDEFAVLLPETDEAQAQVALSHVRIALKDLIGAYGSEVRASIGSVTYAHGAESVAEILRAADTAMYLAKASGRDQIAAVTLDAATSVLPATGTGR